MTAPATAPFPKLSALFRLARIAGWGAASAALSSLAHIVWADRAAIIVAATAAAETAYRKVLPSGVLAGKTATLLAAYRQITAAAKTVEPAVAAVAAAVKTSEAPAGAVPEAPAA